jgi:hypothetical protein
LIIAALFKRLHPVFPKTIAFKLADVEQREDLVPEQVKNGKSRGHHARFLIAEQGTSPPL